MLYVGMIRNGDTESMYVSSVPIEEEDKWELNTTLIDFSTKPSLRGDTIAQRSELQRLANILTDGGAVVTIETP